MEYVSTRTRIGMPVYPFQNGIVKTASGRIRLTESAFLTGNEQTMVQITFKGRNYANVPVLRALTALYIDQIIAELNFDKPKTLFEDQITISYRKDPAPQIYIGVFTLELGKLPIKYSMITDPAIRKRVATAIARLTLSIETSPFFIPDEEVDMIGDAGILKLLGESTDPVKTLAELKEPKEKILSYLGKKINFIRTQFLIRSEIIIGKLLAAGEAVSYQ